MRALQRVVRGLPRRRRGHPGRAIDALDAVVTAGRSLGDPANEQEMVRQIAKMLGARVLLHYAEERYVTLDDQRRHTLSTWSIRRIVRDRAIVVRRVRRRPEFWRPEQRRPRGLLSFPVRGGVACIQRGSPFTPREVRAARAVLRFWRARTEGRPVRNALCPGISSMRRCSRPPTT